MPENDAEPGFQHKLRRRRNRLMSVGVAIFAIVVIAYAFDLLRKQTNTASSETTSLQVRTDLMRGQPCHVANDIIMGDCDAEEVAVLQRQAQRSSSP
jgi:hypothetical protein